LECQKILFSQKISTSCSSTSAWTDTRGGVFEEIRRWGDRVMERRTDNGLFFLNGRQSKLKESKGVVSLSYIDLSIIF
jgi:hypothetical protein